MKEKRTQSPKTQKHSERNNYNNDDILQILVNPPGILPLRLAITVCVLGGGEKRIYIHIYIERERERETEREIKQPKVLNSVFGHRIASWGLVVHNKRNDVVSKQCVLTPHCLTGALLRSNTNGFQQTQKQAVFGYRFASHGFFVSKRNGNFLRTMCSGVALHRRDAFARKNIVSHSLGGPTIRGCTEPRPRLQF